MIRYQHFKIPYILILKFSSVLRFWAPHCAVDSSTHSFCEGLSCVSNVYGVYGSVARPLAGSWDRRWCLGGERLCVQLANGGTRGTGYFVFSKRLKNNIAPILQKPIDAHIWGQANASRTLKGSHVVQDSARMHLEDHENVPSFAFCTFLLYTFASRLGVKTY